MVDDDGDGRVSSIKLNGTNYVYVNARDSVLLDENA